MSIRLIDGSEFLHIPKTGGTWVREVLDRQGLIKGPVGGHEHANYDRVVFETHQRKRPGKQSGLVRRIKQIASGTQPAVSDQSKKTFRFCFVRHPLAWYESWWKYMNARDWNEWGDSSVAGGWHPNLAINGLGSSDFNKFVCNVIDARPGYVSELYFSYAKLGVSFIGKTESLADDLITVAEHLGLPADIEAIKHHGPVNASTTSDQAIEWDPVVRQTLMRLELPALVHFGYLHASELEELGLPGTLKTAQALQRIVSA